MMWKAIGKSVVGVSHLQAGTACEDALQYSLYTSPDNEEILIAFISDGAGSAKQAAMASQMAVTTALSFVTEQLQQHGVLAEKDLYQLADQVYDALQQQAYIRQLPLDEFSCTLLGCIVFNSYACFIQVGDGAIVKHNDNDFYTPVWWPHNGEYMNTTAFINDNSFRYLKVLVTEEAVTELALFTDGLQMLALNYETETAHHPFFKDMFKWLRFASQPEEVAILNGKLEEYLGGALINKLTDDDKTLFLATRLQQPQ